MTTPIKTQCPDCHTSFNIKKTQLNQKTASVCCENCQHSFLVNNNLIVSADTEISSEKIADIDTSSENITVADYDKNSHSNEQITTKKPNKKHSPLSASISDSDDILIFDDMIHDDMDMSTFDDENLEYESLESMDAWLDQTTNSKLNVNLDNTLQKNSPPELDKNPDLSIKVLKNAPSSAQIALSSAEANNIHANIDDNTDESWLENLLKEQKKGEDAPKNETDLSQLLLSMGVSLKEDDHNSAVLAKKVQADFSPTPAKRSVASLLWILGCLVLTLLLFAQYVIFNLDNLVKNPAHAERLKAICSIAACSLPNADLAALTISDLEHRPSRINTANTFSDINVTLNNQSPQAQLYPHVKVSVYGANAIIGEFIAAPNDYLLSTQNQLAAESRRQLLFTIPVADNQISKVTINPIY